MAPSPPLQADTLANAPAYNEIGIPAGPPKGAILLLHGGGFLNTGPFAASSERPQAIRWLQRGWVVLNASYRPCANAPGDAEWFYDRLADRYPGVPLCVSGSSAGASLGAHLVGVRNVACLVSRAGVLDPDWLADQQDAVQRPGEQEGGPRLFGIYTGALGEQGRRALIDRSAFSRAATQMLIVGEDNDYVVPRSQQTDSLAARNAAGAGARTTGLFLAGGEKDPYFVHSQVSSTEYARYVQAEELLAQSVAPPTG